MKIQEIVVRTILGSSQIADYTINPYIGCSHACAYCYAYYYTRRIYGIRDPWGTYVYIKKNAPALLRAEMKYKDPGSIYLSSLTDPYQPLENTRRTTRKILDVIAEYDWPVIVQTKSALVTRDLDILSRMSSVTVGFTIITADERLRNFLEPGASPIAARISALQRIKEEGIKTFVFIGPIMPGTKIRDIAKIVELTLEHADLYYFDRLNVKPYMWYNMERKLPSSLVDFYKTMIASGYYNTIKKEIEELAKDLGIDYVILF